LSKQEDKAKHKTRMHRAWTAIKKQLGIIKARQHFLGASKQIDEAQHTDWPRSMPWTVDSLVA